MGYTERAELDPARRLEQLRELYEYRANNADALFGDPSESRNQEKNRNWLLEDESRYYEGYFTVTNVLYLKRQLNIDKFYKDFFEDSPTLEIDENPKYPVKVSIPTQLMIKTRNFDIDPKAVPTSKTYDPRNSLDIIKHCHRGYLPHFEEAFPKKSRRQTRRATIKAYEKVSLLDL
ncbi:hypothetical protein ROZALSC1DRAFT_28370 [Rozella allomycis CSF55]|uniref:Uncharacterized protein n=1 Tax=Rozella allomycis (strain CSF55) TaxID=988480 RepID=A0A075APS3_ROZAC|nr:hypothetical protein O9G_003925 [Rozella allomycis CSF55]RKP20100.1 hypothetical protein ROZALSC1DRAFT_28370 [Rozella allomycis CSF55]|eukprot:EPZ32078.1 hypothetical protein O9G_003925 [Rozella allomycis CSF55]